MRHRKMFHCAGNDIDPWKVRQSGVFEPAMIRTNPSDATSNLAVTFCGEPVLLIKAPTLSVPLKTG